MITSNHGLSFGPTIKAPFTLLSLFLLSLLYICLLVFAVGVSSRYKTLIAIKRRMFGGHFCGKRDLKQRAPNDQCFLSLSMPPRAIECIAAETHLDLIAPYL